MDTHTYKRIGDVELKVDVHLPAEFDQPRPVVITIHGGALIMGSRESVMEGLAARLLNADVIVVSPDYRLAPETKLPEIWSDIEDLFAWVRESGPDLFGADPERIGVHGNSAGGYLSLMSGCRIDPAPRVVAAYAGYASLTGPWYLQPDAWYCNQEPIEETYARSTVGFGIPTDGNTGKNRSAYYIYLRQNGLWSDEVGGMSVETLRNYCPIDLATEAYPPALLYHGNADHDVPFSESENFAAKLDALGVEHRFLPLEGVDHIFEGASEKDVEHVHEQTAAFMVGCLKMM